MSWQRGRALGRRQRRWVLVSCSCLLAPWDGVSWAFGVYAMRRRGSANLADFSALGSAPRARDGTGGE